MRDTLTFFLAWILYPLWLVAGAVDYFCHRRTRIADTAGLPESSLHVVQFVLLAGVLVLALFFPISVVTYAAMVCLVLAHSATAYIDVRYTLGRRHISALEQQAHGLMDVIPLVAVGLIGVMNWTVIAGAAPRAATNAKVELGAWLIVGTFALLGGGPVLEEWMRVAREQSRRPPR